MTRHSILFLTGAALLLAAASCQVAELDRAGNAQQEITITADFENEGIILADGEDSVPETKTMRLASGSVLWTPGDQISIFYGDDKGVAGGSKFTSDIETAAEITNFKGKISAITGGGEVTVEDTYFWSVYPYKETNRCNGSSVTIVLPSEQQSAEDTFSKGQWPTMGKSKGLRMSFRNICCGYKFKVETAGIESVTISTGDPNRALAGTLNVIMDGDNPKVKSVTDGSSSVTVTPEGGGTFKPNVYYFAIMRPNVFKDGVSITFATAEKTATYNCSVADSNKEYPSDRGRFKVMDNKDHGLAWTLKDAAALPQGLKINDLLDYEDINSVIFETDVATPTGTAISGTTPPIYYSYSATSPTDPSDTRIDLHIQTQEAGFLAAANSSGLFSGMANLTEIKGLDKVDFSLATDLSDIFKGCAALTSLDLHGMNTSSAQDMSGMFDGCRTLATITFGPDFAFTAGCKFDGMFNSVGFDDPDNDGFYSTFKCTDAQWEQIKAMIPIATMLHYRHNNHQILPGVFSVSPTKKVNFSPGNLYYDGTSFRLEENQKDFQVKEVPITDSGFDDTMAESVPGHISYFEWQKQIPYSGESVTPSADDVLFTNKTEDTPNPDFIVDGKKGIWRTLSKDEWKYLLFERTMTGGKPRWDIIKDSQFDRLVIYPDDYSGADYSDSMTDAQTDGAGIVVFANTRGLGNTSFFDNIGYYYWSSTPEGIGSAHMICFDYCQVDIYYFSEEYSDLFSCIRRTLAHPIRLVTDVK